MLRFVRPLAFFCLALVGDYSAYSGIVQSEVVANLFKTSGSASHLLLLMHHQRIAGDFDKAAGCKGGLNAGQIRAQQLFQFSIADIAGRDQ